MCDAGTIGPRLARAGATTQGASASTSRSTADRPCSYGLNADYLAILQNHGLVISGRDELGEVRVAELPAHPFCVASLFQPELSSDPTWVHPLIAAFAAAVRTHAAAPLAGAVMT